MRKNLFTYRSPENACIAEIEMGPVTSKSFEICTSVQNGIKNTVILSYFMIIIRNYSKNKLLYYIYITITFHGTINILNTLW